MIMFLDELGVSCASLWIEMIRLYLMLECSCANVYVRAHRMSPTCPKSRSTLERTCPGTWPRCTRCASHIQTSCGRWATAGERSRSETVQTQRRRTSAWFNLRFLRAARAEKAAGHHRAPPAEAGSVCHVQQQQVVPHSSSSSMFPPSHQASRSGTQKRGSVARATLITLAPLLPPPSILSSSNAPTHPHTHLPSCPVHHRTAMQQ